MSRNFSHLRFGEFSKAATTGAIAGALAFQPFVANAALGSQHIAVGNGHWFVNTNIAFNTTSSNWGFSEGSLVTASGIRRDAFDGALSWLVSTGTPTRADGYRSPGGVVDLTATTVTGTTQVMAGLNVSGQMYFSSARAVARSILILQNPTASPITVNVENATNRGSDANTTHHMTSSGDATVDAADNWLVSSQGAVPLTTVDPILTFAFSQDGAAVHGTFSPMPANGSDKIDKFYTVTVPAGQTRRLMAFVQMSGTVAGAEADATLFNTNASLRGTDYLSGLSVIDMSEIVNWNLQPVNSAVPTLNQWAVGGLASLLGLFGLVRLGFSGQGRRNSVT